jgi:superoxide dismutase, Cu-Zn family
MRDQLKGNQSHAKWWRRALIAAGAVLAMVSAGCAHQGNATPGSATAHNKAKPAVLLGNGTLMAADSGSATVTYNPELAPVGAAMTAVLVPSAVESRDGATTRVEFAVSGFLPNRGYAAHVHTKACGAKADDSGPHFQNNVDPAATPQSPSSDPRYANPKNEIWLDLHTDGAGAGSAHVTVPFVLTDRVPGSIVVHEGMQTQTEPGNAGKAGARIACLTLSSK